MKMKGARIEFVPFDAQDVITTSGKPYFSKSLTGYYGTPIETYISDSSCFRMALDDNGMYGIDQPSNLAPVSNFYSLNSAEWYEGSFNYIYYILNVTPSSTQPSGNELDRKALLEWLQTNATEKIFN